MNGHGSGHAEILLLSRHTLPATPHPSPQTPSARWKKRLDEQSYSHGYYRLLNIRILPVAPEHDFVRETMIAIPVHDGNSDDRAPRLLGPHEQ